jgi:hypothetical protein
MSEPNRTPEEKIIAVLYLMTHKPTNSAVTASLIADMADVHLDAVKAFLASGAGKESVITTTAPGSPTTEVYRIAPHVRRPLGNLKWADKSICDGLLKGFDLDP